MIEGKDALCETWLQSSQARRLGFKPERLTRIREDCLTYGQPGFAVEGSLAFVLAAGFSTTVSQNGMPMLIAPDSDKLYEFDTDTERFIPSQVEYDVVHSVHWGCVALIFKDLLAPVDSARRSYGAFSHFTQGQSCFETITESELPFFRENVIFVDDCLGFVEDEPHFNSALSVPISVNELHDFRSFRLVFPSDEEIECRKQAVSKLSNKQYNDTNDEVVDSEKVGRIVISYRHQEYSTNRITFDDWLCACSTLQLVFEAYGWQKARFWTDARLRLINAERQYDLPWGKMGLEPYTLGVVVVFNLAKRPSICDRFWLTLERKSGAHYYATWLTDDTGDVFCYKIPSKLDDIYPRSVVTSVSTSQGITFSQDRLEILEDMWDELEVESAEDAVQKLYEKLTVQARHDYLDEDLDDIEIMEKGKTIQWCGDIEGLIDPPSLMEVFGDFGKYRQGVKMRVLEIDKFKDDTRIVVVVMEFEYEKSKEWVAKRLYVDKDGEIRARSIPRLVDEDYAENLLKSGPSREVDIVRERPKWMLSQPSTSA